MTNAQKVLVVEDDPLIGADIQATLTGFGYEVLGPISSGEEVLRDIQSLKPQFILMDINLAGKLDGIQTAEALQRKSDAPLVFLSALNDEETLQRAKLVNPFGYLIKPFDGNELRATIELTLHRYTHEQPSSAVASVAVSGEVLEDEEITGEKMGSYLSRLPVFQGIPGAAIEQIASVARVKKYDAGEFLIREGHAPVSVFIPTSGRISVTKTADSGKELIVALLAPGDSFGLFYTLSAFSGSTSAKTQVASKVISIPMAVWVNILEQHPIFYKNLVNSVAERLAAAHTLSSSLAHARVEGRIVNTLIALLPEFGKGSRNGSNEGRIFITRKELSELTGTTPETAIRVTKNLEREGMLDLTRPGIIKIPNIESFKKVLTT